MDSIAEKYNLLVSQLRELIDTDDDFLPVLSNASALLWEALDRINWAGFYIVRDDRLVLGPFQGKVACIHIAKGRGVCGTAWERNETLRVPDVHLFPGHIACDSASRSEIVIPIRRNDEVVAVLDIDSPFTGRFTCDDQEGLERFADLIGRETRWG